MQCQILFSGKNKKIIINLLCAAFARREVKVKSHHIIVVPIDLCVQIFSNQHYMRSIFTNLQYSRTSMAQTSLGSWKFVRDMSSSSH